MFLRMKIAIIHEDCIKKIMESGAIPMRYRGNRKIETIDIATLDYSTWKGRNKGLEKKWYLSRLNDRANRLEYDSSKGKTTRIVTEQAKQSIRELLELGRDKTPGWTQEHWQWSFCIDRNRKISYQG